MAGTSRRELLGLVTVGVTAAIAGCGGETTDDEEIADEEILEADSNEKPEADESSEAGLLVIEGGTEQVLSGDVEESYTGIEFHDGGALVFENGATLELQSKVEG